MSMVDCHLEGIMKQAQVFVQCRTADQFVELQADLVAPVGVLNSGLAVRV
jgi:hypothetical protein